MSLLSVPNFSPIGVRIRVLWRILQSVRKEEIEEKNQEKKTQTLAARISKMAGAIFFKFGMLASLQAAPNSGEFGAAWSIGTKFT